MGLLDLMGKLGLPTKLENGHDLGCGCAVCRAIMARKTEESRARYEAHEAPQSILEIIANERRKRGAH